MQLIIISNVFVDRHSMLLSTRKNDGNRMFSFCRRSPWCLPGPCWLLLVRLCAISTALQRPIWRTVTFWLLCAEEDSWSLAPNPWLHGRISFVQSAGGVWRFWEKAFKTLTPFRRKFDSIFCISQPRLSPIGEAMAPCWLGAMKPVVEAANACVTNWWMWSRSLAQDLDDRW
jgi:hypothetical protein